jgi:HJR/Mrr/RecB family endonuclease
MINVKPISQWSDRDVEAEIDRIRSAIQSWAEGQEIWHDAGFSSKLEDSGGEPSEEPVVTLFHAEWAISSIMESDLEPEFTKLLDNMGYYYENENNVTIAVYASDDERRAKFYEYFHWKWVCSLLIEDTGDVYEELYNHFAKCPDDLHRLHWREFEVLLFRIFQNHGYRALLGPGRSDGGIDLRLWQPNPIGDVLTVVQAKCYAQRNKIDLQPVQALYGAAKAEQAAQALFVTTSSYMRAARNFASRVSSELQLAEGEHIVAWCTKATNGIIKDKSTLVARATVKRMIETLTHSASDPRIVHGTWGYDMIHNTYAMVIKETKHAALLLSIRNKKISDDGYGTRGTEIPLLDATAMDQFNELGVMRASRSVDANGRVSYWTGDQLYSRWDGLPNHFDYID